MKKRDIFEKGIRFVRVAAKQNISLYAANACFFLVLAALPTLLLLLGILRYTPLDVERLNQLLADLLPQAFGEGARRLIRMAYEKTSASALSVTAVTALWSASRGIFGIMTGLSAIYGVEEDRGYFVTRGISVVYLFFFLVVLVLTLALHVFGTELLGLLYRLPVPGLDILRELVDLRFFLLLGIQTAFFTAMFMVLPGGRRRFRDSLPGALLASSGWLIFSDIYSIYVERFVRLRDAWGSVYALAPAMLWLYFCMKILFWGGALNRYLMDRRI